MRHVPVLLNEVIEGLNLEPGKNVIDCTLGDAGHSEKILEKIGTAGKLLGIDADPEAILRAKQYLYKFDKQVIFVRNNFVHLKTIVEENKFKPVNGILMDFGWSTPQFEERGRGFSFQNNNEILDMRYGGNSKTAGELISELDENELEKIFREYGEENLSKEIAEMIVEIRKEKVVKTVKDLVEIILLVYRKKLKTNKEIPWVGGLHPATKVFQALRIAVNNEFGVIEEVLPQAIEVLQSGGRLAVITFHSLEDRIVKHYFKSQENKTIKLINKKPVVCSEEEYKNNPRARSAKLRIIEKL
ncbi:MAG: 16S rRNA (cytosine(1402)-N(4))-methyltransferase RsmH [Candidatus Magasanikiibacteriota bacterium]